MKNLSEFFILFFFPFLVVKFSMYLNRRIFVMRPARAIALSDSLLEVLGQIVFVSILKSGLFEMVKSLIISFLFEHTPFQKGFQVTTK